jgi:predicted enzyme related to lactoylglutathione lyase
MGEWRAQMSETVPMTSKIVWFELPADDTRRAQDF